MRVCIDTNVWISGFVFSGAPSIVIDYALKKKFNLVLSNFILDEIERNLISKFDVTRAEVRKLRQRITKIADVYEPAGQLKVIPKMHADNIVLETALLGKAKILVTGDRKHLLPLKFYKHIRILEPSEFLRIHFP